MRSYTVAKGENKAGCFALLRACFFCVGLVPFIAVFFFVDRDLNVDLHV